MTSRLFIAVLCAPVALYAQQPGYSFDHAQKFLVQYCEKCHQDKAPLGGFRLSRVATPESLKADANRWLSLTNRVKNGEMPPKGAPAPPIDAREAFGAYVHEAVHQAACSSGIVPGRTLIRRLNRDEYSHTIRDLLDMHMDIARSLPIDGAGGEGFDNAAETLFLSPLHSEKYLEVAKFAMDFAAKEYKSHARIFIAKPGPGVTPEQAARKIVNAFLPRAFRRPTTPAEAEPYIELFRAAQQQGETFEAAVLYALRGVLVSPNFLFRVEPPNPTAAPRPMDQYSMASRLSYFLWGSMPDELLFDLAARNKLQDPEVLRQLVRIMLRNDRSVEFAQSFVEQWLHTRELSGDKAPDPKLFPTFTKDEDLRSDIRYQPILFFREVFLQNLSLTNFLDSDHSIGTRKLATHFDLKLNLRPNQTSQPHWIDLPPNSNRGGLLGMPAVLSVSSHPYRTSPVLRGAWILESLLGTPPPPPPANVPPLEETKQGDAPKTVRERLAQHSQNAVCASCHARIDPFGFALENYDVTGRWRSEEAGKPIDASAQLLDGSKFSGPAELRKILLDRKDLFVRHLTNKMLGYALGRGLTIQDSCTVDAIVEKVKQNSYSSQTLLEEIVLSVPFRQQAGALPAPELRPTKEQAKK
ncbi:MAG TPA: DUF1588 domain-containing protein [Bryobacteraceae bacterium]|nr:DUF1588 domain-containing protein [Bryobacteraceae bacterium]